MTYYEFHVSIKKKSVTQKVKNRRYPTETIKDGVYTDNLELLISQIIVNCKQ